MLSVKVASPYKVFPYLLMLTSGIVLSQTRSSFIQSITFVKTHSQTTMCIIVRINGLNLNVIILAEVMVWANILKLRATRENFK